MVERLPLYRFPGLDAPGVVHAVSTRLGGASQGPYAGLNLGHTVGDAPQAVAINHSRLFAALEIAPERIVSAQQVHGSRVAVVTAAEAGQVLSGTDALISATPGLYLMLRYADCVPVLLYDPQRRAVGLAHAGWQGTVAQIAACTVRAMGTLFGCRPEDMWAGIGPSIGPCCYQVGPEVVAAVQETHPKAAGLIRRRQPDGHAHLDLWAANAYQLSCQGLRRIEIARLCTACRTDLFYSHRAEQGHTGRMAAITGLRPDGV